MNKFQIKRYCDNCDYIGYESASLVKGIEVPDGLVCPKCREVLGFNSVDYYVECINNTRCGGNYPIICDEEQLDWYCVCGEHEEIKTS
jgi:hypothetical protein|tara:strand:+ start:165 stop:428 length:264 start_codon:yes stop_codon:yes gene_type:complete